MIILHSKAKNETEWEKVKPMLIKTITIITNI
jgi:hypothetical protein